MQRLQWCSPPSSPVVLQAVPLVGLRVAQRLAVLRLADLLPLGLERLPVALLRDQVPPLVGLPQAAPLLAPRLLALLLDRLPPMAPELKPVRVLRLAALALLALDWLLVPGRVTRWAPELARPAMV